MERFDNAASTWDANPMRIKLSEAIAQAMEQTHCLKSTYTIMDFGAGTGLISFLLSKKVKHVYAIDTSEGMIAELKRKINESGVRNITPQKRDVLNDRELKQQLESIVSSMAFHHVAEPLPLIKRFFEILKKGGSVLIADLEKEDGDFHKDKHGVHHFGFDPERLAAEFRKAGFTRICYETVYKIKRTTETQPKKIFPVFLLSAIK